MAVTPKPANENSTGNRSCYNLPSLIRASCFGRALQGRACCRFVCSFISSRGRTCGNVGIASFAISKCGGTAVWFPSRGISIGLLCGRLSSPAARSAFEYVTMMKQAVQHCAHRCGVPQQFAPILHGTVRRQQRTGTLIAPHHDLE